MKRDTFADACEGQEDDKPRWPMVEQVNRDHQPGPDSRLFVAPTGVEIDEPDLSARGLRHGSLFLQTVGHGDIP